MRETFGRSAVLGRCGDCRFAEEVPVDIRQWLIEKGFDDDVVLCMDDVYGPSITTLLNSACEHIFLRDDEDPTTADCDSQTK